MQGSFEITREIDIDASPEMVFRFFTEVALLERWLVCPGRGRRPPGRRLRVQRDRKPHNPRDLPGRGAGPPAGLHVAVRSRRVAAAEHGGGNVDAGRARDAGAPAPPRLRGSAGA